MWKHKRQVGFTLIEVLLLMAMTILMLLLYKASQGPIDPKQAINAEKVEDRQRLAAAAQAERGTLAQAAPPTAASGISPEQEKAKPSASAKVSVDAAPMSPSNLAIIETLGLFGILLVGLALFARRMIKKAGLGKAPALDDTP